MKYTSAPNQPVSATTTIQIIFSVVFLNRRVAASISIHNQKAKTSNPTSIINPNPTPIKGNHILPSIIVPQTKHYCDEVLPAMLEVRKAADQLESIVADDLWSLPTYQEMLFIK